MEEYKNKIAQDALQLFLKLGVRSVTMDDVSSQLGISKKTVYKYFANKPELIDYAFHIYFEQIIEIMTGVHERSRNAIDELFEMDEVMCSLTRSWHPGVLFQLRKYYPETWATIERRRSESIMHFVRENLLSGIEVGLYRPEIKVDIITELYMSKTTIFINKDFFQNTPYSLADVATENLEYHMRGITTPKGLKYFESKIKDRILCK